MRQAAHVRVGLEHLDALEGVVKLSAAVPAVAEELDVEMIRNLASRSRGALSDATAPGLIAAASKLCDKYQRPVSDPGVTIAAEPDAAVVPDAVGPSGQPGSSVQVWLFVPDEPGREPAADPEAEAHAASAELLARNGWDAAGFHASLLEEFVRTHSLRVQFLAFLKRVEQSERERRESP